MYCKSLFSVYNKVTGLPAVFYSNGHYQPPFSGIHSAVHPLYLFIHPIQPLILLSCSLNNLHVMVFLFPLSPLLSSSSHTQTFPFPLPSAPSRPPQQPVPRPRCWVAGRFLYTARLYGIKHRPSWRCRARRQYAASASTSRGATKRKPTTSRATQPPSVSRSEQ